MKDHKLNLTHKKYSEDELENNINSFDLDYWHYISVYQFLSEYFIEKHSGKVNWGGISLYQELSEQFIKKHINKIDIYCLIRNINISEEIKNELSTIMDII